MGKVRGPICGRYFHGMRTGSMPSLARWKREGKRTRHKEGRGAPPVGGLASAGPTQHDTHHLAVLVQVPLLHYVQAPIVLLLQLHAERHVVVLDRELQGEGRGMTGARPFQPPVVLAR